MDKLLLGKFDQIDLESSRNNSSKFSDLYKNNLKMSQKQNQRREEILKNSRCKRDQLILSIRRLVSDISNDKEIDTQDDETSTDNKLAVQDKDSDDSEMPEQHDDIGENDYSSSSPSLCTDDSNESKPTEGTKKEKKLLNEKKQEYKKFRNKAMLSEWLLHKPKNFESEWVLKATPVGKRCLLLSRNGNTIAYSRTGKFIKNFQSALPGGCKLQSSQGRRQFAILDCIYNHRNVSFYLMDCLAWNEHKLYESEASFRFYWLQSRFNEFQESFQSLNPNNESRFYCLKTYTASEKDIREALTNDPLIKDHNLELDGLLFFHCQGPYVPGANPLVLWIKPDMVDQVLNQGSQ